MNESTNPILEEAVCSRLVVWKGDYGLDQIFFVLF